MELLIPEKTKKGLLELDMNNEDTNKITSLNQQMATIEDDYLNVLPLR